MTKYGLDNSCDHQYYRLEQFSGVWASKMLYLGQYCRFLFFSIDFITKLAQIEPFGNSVQRKRHNMALVTVAIRNTIDESSLVEFEQVKCFIWINIVDFYFSMDFRTKLAQIEPFEYSGHRKRHNMALVTLVIRNTIAESSLVKFEHLAQYCRFLFFHGF